MSVAVASGLLVNEAGQPTGRDSGHKEKETASCRRRKVPNERLTDTSPGP